MQSLVCNSMIGEQPPLVGCLFQSELLLCEALFLCFMIRIANLLPSRFSLRFPNIGIPRRPCQCCGRR
jgi:hypothetical protein